MILELARTDRNSKRAMGTLRINNRFVAYTLEPAEPIIPPGNYKITITYSPKFKKPLPLVNGVTGHSGVRIHVGNGVDDTDGCILVGLNRTVDMVLQSALAMDNVQHQIEKALEEKQEVLLHVWQS